MKDNADPAEAVIEAAIEAARTSFESSDKGVVLWSSAEKIDDAITDAIRAAAPILAKHYIQHGRELERAQYRFLWRSGKRDVYYGVRGDAS